MSGYALLKRPLGGPWNASKEIQRTGRRFHHIDKSSYGPPHIGQVGKTYVSAVPALQPLKRYCKSAPRTWGKKKASRTLIRPPHQGGTKISTKAMKDNSSSILYPSLPNGDSKRSKGRRQSQFQQFKILNRSSSYLHTFTHIHLSILHSILHPLLYESNSLCSMFFLKPFFNFPP